jgi:hypothetical protein
MATTRLATSATPGKPYGATGDNVFDPKAESGIVDPPQESGGNGMNSRRKTGIGR